MLEHLLQADIALRAWLTSHHNPLADIVMVTLSVAGRGGMLFLALGVLLVLARRIPLSAFWQLMLAILLAAQLTDKVAKPLIARARPFNAIADVRVLGSRPTTFAFPSGHAANAFAGAYVLSRATTGAVRAGWWMLAVAVALSRVYLGVHYPLDILAGAILGIACATFVVGGSRWDQPIKS